MADLNKQIAYVTSLALTLKASGAFDEGVMDRAKERAVEVLEEMKAQAEWNAYRKAWKCPLNDLSALGSGPAPTW